MAIEVAASPYGLLQLLARPVQPYFGISASDAKSFGNFVVCQTAKFTQKENGLMVRGELSDFSAYAIAHVLAHELLLGRRSAVEPSCC